MMLLTIDHVPGREIAQVFGLVRGNTVRAGDLHQDVQAFLKNLVGGEITEHTKLTAEAREQALDRLIADARARGADAIVGVRFATSDVDTGAAEFLAYGTAVKLR